ncbi:helix-turn-helix domain-containing protein [Streptomyces sp. NPDC091279]|uniref:TetR/AcrR family transcriptional regulator n=1 Tax=unclassified Streptomyces TaxID=2593676 RepID=UPI00380CE14E
MTKDAIADERRPANGGPRAAARNRAALITAAREIYAQQGLDAPLSAVARRAGVGQGVLYRHFPDRAAVTNAVLEGNVRQIERAGEAEGATFAGLLGVLTWHLTGSAAFIGLVHADVTSGRTDAYAYVWDLADRVETALRAHLPDGAPLGAGEDLMLALAMVSGTVTGATREEREHRALAAWRLLGVEVGPVRPFEE